MRRRLMVGLLMLIDAAIVWAVLYIAFFIRFEGNVEYRYYEMILKNIAIVIPVYLTVFYCFGLYHRLWRYASINELLTIPAAVSVGSVILSVYLYFTVPGFPRSIYILSWGLNIALIGSSRLATRIIINFRHLPNFQVMNVLIVGAGDAGAMIAREIQQRFYNSKKIVGFIDDDKYKHGQRLFGVKVLGGRRHIKRIVKEYEVGEIIIAIPSAGGGVIRKIVSQCKQTGCSVKIMPGIYELIDGKAAVQQLRNVELEDLLRREPVKLDLTGICAFLSGKRVLVTGAGGSIGSELCRQIAKLSPNILVLLGKGENSIYEINRELREKYPALRIEPIIADIRDYQRINNIFGRFRPQVVFHAAAHKHVPLMESQPEEAVQNNIFGTKNVAEAADWFGAEVFVQISTDKAVNPTSVMGATKRVAELVIQNISRHSRTKFVTVRFGNVLGSRGSVIPLFKQQIAKGGPVTITHPEVIRYFMTIPEAVQLVLQAGSMAQGGEVFVLDMGEPIKILDMACELIELSGLVPYKDIKIKFTGLRPGEKLYEELLTAEEGTAATRHEKIFVANLKEYPEQKLLQELGNLQQVSDPEEVISLLMKIIPSYQPNRVSIASDESNYFSDGAAVDLPIGTQNRVVPSGT
ncbi:MAG: polysaccharide biosynthesis protein [Firmicutes bacterium]|nr:polysaccharide biosynthesis protein [Bacillota bacterium]